MQADSIRRGMRDHDAAKATALGGAGNAHSDNSNNSNNSSSGNDHTDVTDTSIPTSAQQQERTRQRTLFQQPVVLRLMHITKAYHMAKTVTKVHALNDITLCEADRLEQAAERPLATAASGATQLEDNTDSGGSDGGNGGGGSSSDGVTLATTADGIVVSCSSECRAELAMRMRQPFAPIHRGEFVMIRGPSGGGKTTLLNIIGLIDVCSDGVIELNGMRITKKMGEAKLADLRLRTIGFVFQTFNLIPTMTAAENVELPMTLLGKLSHRAMRLRARQLLTLVGLRNRVNHLPSELSGGEQQRVTIARSLANNPSILLLDEPTGDLDTVNTIEIMDLLLRINRHTRTTCIMVTHNPDVECYADRILYVSDGRFVKEVHNATPMLLDAKRYSAYLDAEEQRMMRGRANEDADDDDTDLSPGHDKLCDKSGSLVFSSHGSRRSSAATGAAVPLSGALGGGLASPHYAAAATAAAPATVRGEGGAA